MSKPSQILKTHVSACACYMFVICLLLLCDKLLSIHKGGSSKDLDLDA